MKETTKETQVVDKPEVSELSKITGKYVIKNNRKTMLTTMPGNKDGRDLHAGTFTMFTPELDPVSRGIRTGITNPKLQAELEQELNLTAGTLSAFNREFWGTYFIKIPHEGYVLECDNNVRNKLNLLLMRACSKFYSDGLSGASQPALADFIITSTEKEKAKESKILELKERAFAKLHTMSIQDRLDFLKVFEEGKYYTSNSNADFVNASINRVLEDSPTKFLETFRNPYYKEAIFLKDCLSIKAVIKQGPRYFVNGGEKLGDSYLQTLQNLQSDDWQEVKISLLGKLQAHK
jgi:hypothetical protein